MNVDPAAVASISLDAVEAGASKAAGRYGTQA